VPCIVIIGNGVAGVTAARHIRKRSDDEIVIISDETEYFFSRTALMYVYMGHMRYEDTKPYENWFWAKNRIDLVRGRVESIKGETKELLMADGSRRSYDVLIIASGSKSNRFGWPGQDLKGVQGLYNYQDLQSMEALSEGLEHAVIVGGGLIGVEMAEMFHSRGIETTFLVREKSWMEHAFPIEESEMINREIRANNIDLRLGTELDRIVDDGSGRVKAVVTKGGDEIECGFVGLTVGVSPNIDFLEGSGIECGRGVLVDQFLKTNLPDVYAIGDCAELRKAAKDRRTVEPLWYTGRAMGETVARTISGEKRAYVQDIWFNSAKFFNLEWQVYGRIVTQPDDLVESLYWESPEGEKAIRINFLKADRAVIGFNLMGIRYRHEVCDRWIRDRFSIEQVLSSLGAANFDPEFFTQYEQELLDLYNRSNRGQKIRLSRRRGLRSALAALKVG